MKINKAERGWDYKFTPDEGKQLRVWYMKDGAIQAWGLDEVWLMEEYPEDRPYEERVTVSTKQSEVSE
jgi:hypothetical protein